MITTNVPPETKQALGTIEDFRQAGRRDEAITLCQKLLKVSGPMPALLVSMAEIASDSGDDRHAEEILDIAIDRLENDGDLLMRAAALLRKFGQVTSAQTLLLAASRLPQTAFSAALSLGSLFEATERWPEALNAYERASLLNPGHAHASTRRGMILLRHQFGLPNPSPESKRQAPGLAASFSMTTLGSNGRFGNQLLQYGFARLYGQAHNLRVDVPAWMGRYLFDLDDAYPSGGLPVAQEQGLAFAQSLTGDLSPSLANHDLWGYCCYPTSYLRPQQALFRQLYTPGKFVTGLVTKAIAQVRAEGETVVALHLRRGDFGNGSFWIAPEAWYLAWLRQIWPTLHKPVLYIATDDSTTRDAFHEFAPLGPDALGLTIPGAEFFLDFSILCNADVLAISNSTFSFAAAMLNERAQTFMRPDPHTQNLRSYDPWDADVLLTR